MRDYYILDEGTPLGVVDIAVEARGLRDAAAVVGEVDVRIYLSCRGLGEALREGLAVDDRAQVFGIADQAGVIAEAVSAVNQDILAALVGERGAEQDTAVEERGEADVREVVTAAAIAKLATRGPATLGVIVGTDGQIHASV